jgi:Uma2 family endonuclease
MSPEVEALIAQRRRLGQDTHDEVWDGEYHMSPAAHSHRGIVCSELMSALRPAARSIGLRSSDAFNLGSPDDYRVPDGGFHRQVPDGVWVAPAAIVIEVVSPDDESFNKFDFYAAHGVEEMFIAEPTSQSIFIYTAINGMLVETNVSGMLGLSAAQIVAAIDWPG